MLDRTHLALGIGVSAACEAAHLAPELLAGPVESSPDPLHPPIVRRRRASFGAIFSVLLHVSAALAFVSWGSSIIDPGTIARPSDAISIELVETEVTQQADAAATAAQASAASVAQKLGSETDALSTQAELDQAKKEPTPDPTKANDKPDATPAPAAAPVADSVDAQIDVNKEQPIRPAATEPVAESPPNQPEVTPPARPNKIQTSKLEQQFDPQTKKKSVKGGAQASSARANSSRSGRVSATTGNSADYAARVQARVASRRPSGGGKSATAWVSFGVTRSGGLAYARIGRSSGVSSLDQAAVGAVRSAAPFPVPPPGVNLSFSMPFYFR